MTIIIVVIIVSCIFIIITISISIIISTITMITITLAPGRRLSVPEETLIESIGYSKHKRFLLKPDKPAAAATRPVVYGLSRRCFLVEVFCPRSCPDQLHQKELVRSGARALRGQGRGRVCQVRLSHEQQTETFRNPGQLRRTTGRSRSLRQHRWQL